jgi:hypothetical protein
MLAGPPLPLVPEYPLAQLIGLIDPRAAQADLGVWVDFDALIPLYVTARGRSCRMVLSGDLGLLLGRCRHVAVRQEGQVRVLAVEMLMRWRTLEVVMPAGCSPSPERLQQIFPSAVIEPTGFRVRVDNVPPESVLAECLTHGLPVAESRITYDMRPPPC